MSLDNLRRVAEKALPHERKSAINSYFRYQHITARIAEKHGFGLRVGAAVFAALSPNNDYDGNLRDCNSLLMAAANGLKLESFKVSTYGNNKRKAWEIAHGAEPLDLIVAKKTRSFFKNIYDPLDPVPVTVDGHMFNAWRAERVKLTGLKSSDKDYEIVAEGVRQLAVEYAIVPSQAQGIVWITHRRLHHIKTSFQREFWDADFLAARLGFFPSEA